MTPTAADISILQTLAILDGPCLELAQGVADRRYAFWLGSGISRDRVDDLKAILGRVLAFLHGNAKLGDPTCTYGQALDQALAFAELSAAELAVLDRTAPIHNWPLFPTIIDRLRGRYAEVLDIRIDKQRPDYLLWDVVDVRTTFADPNIIPDCEHLCVAVLVMEGAIANVVSANWDGLIERALADISGGATNILKVCVSDADFRTPELRGRLLKLHGCAIRASTAEATYRDLLIARESQIVRWPNDPSCAVMRQQVISLATLSPTLMIGLSAQDSNIKSVFIAGEATMGWAWPSHPPAYLFAEDALGTDQVTLLKCVYRDAYDANPRAIEASAHVRAFAKPLLVALVLHVLCTKLITYVRYATAPNFTPPDFDILAAGLRHLRDGVAPRAEPDRFGFAMALIEHSGRALSIFREGAAPRGAHAEYRPLGVLPIAQVGADPGLPISGLPELAAVLGILGAGQAAGYWSIRCADPTSSAAGTLQVVPSNGRPPQRLFLVANAEAALQLKSDGVVQDNEHDAVVVYSTAPATRLPRSPRSAPGRTGTTATREVGLRAILRDAISGSDLAERFREEALL